MSFRDKFQAAANFLRKTPKATATILLREAQDSLKGRNLTSEDMLQAQIDLVAAARASKIQPLRSYSRLLADRSLPLQNNALKTNAALTLYPNARTTILIKQFMTASNNKLIEESLTPDGRKSLAIWNEKTRSRDIHEEIYTEPARDGRTSQFTAYYDVKNKRITLNYAGTVFTDIDDLKSVSQTISEAPSMRMTRVEDCIDQTVKSFNKLYPDKIAKTPIDVYAHSAGANSLPLTNYFLQRKYDLVPRAQIMIDPFGAKISFQKVADMIALSENRSSEKVLAELSQNIVSFKPAHQSFVEGFKKLKMFNPALGNSPETIGEIKVVDVGGNSFSAHQIRTWVKYFNNEELREAQKPRRLIFKKLRKQQP